MIFWKVRKRNPDPLLVALEEAITNLDDAFRAQLPVHQMTGDPRYEMERRREDERRRHERVMVAAAQANAAAARVIWARSTRKNQEEK